ncbi:MAG TPA: DUF952 domain-containing protein [Flavisolibacter sp.]|jgi:uncharacterized protein (DUF952 family)|nr:DUF952 domain-containing protein [Flavisolibacter sp.]
MEPIYHVTTAAEWKAAQQKGYYEAASLPTEGFIHCSKADQVAGVLQRYFSGQTQLVKLTIDPSRLQHRLQFDFSPTMNEDFPHVYGPINLEAVVQVEAIA